MKLWKTLKPVWNFSRLCNHWLKTWKSFCCGSGTLGCFWIAIRVENDTCGDLILPHWLLYPTQQTAAVSKNVFFVCRLENVTCSGRSDQAWVIDQNQRLEWQLPAGPIVDLVPASILLVEGAEMQPWHPGTAGTGSTNQSQCVPKMQVVPDKIHPLKFFSYPPFISRRFGAVLWK